MLLRSRPSFTLSKRGVFSFYKEGYTILKFYTYAELKDKLHNINSIDTIDEMHAIQSFKTHGYFNLVNNYKEDIKKIQQSKSLDINDLLAIREIDNDLQSLIFKYLIQIESTFKSHLSYLMAEKFGVNKSEYTDGKNYHTHMSAAKLFRKIESKDHIDFNKDPANHYIQKHDDLPPWVYLKHIPLGDTKNIYKELKTEDKVYIIDEMIPSISYQQDAFKLQCFREHLDLIHDFRNSIAHGGRLLNYIADKRVKNQHYTQLLSKSVISNKNIRNYDKRLYQLLLSIMIMIKDEYLKEKYIAEIESLYQYFINAKGNNFTDVFLEVSRLPNDFIFKLIQTKKDLTS